MHPDPCLLDRCVVPWWYRPNLPCDFRCNLHGFGHASNCCTCCRFIELVSRARPRGPPRRVSAYEISKSTGFQVDFGFQNGFLDFKVDFWISKWISGFQSGFLDFKADFWISKWISRGISGFQANFWISKRISGFQSGFLEGFLDLTANFRISKRISGFHLNRYYSKIQLKYTHDSSTAFLSACMLTEYKVTGTSPLHSAQAACSLIVIHIRILWFINIQHVRCSYIM